MRRTVAAIAALSLTGCYRTIRPTPPPQPAKVMPAVSLDGEPGEGLSRVVLDSSAGPALVEKVKGASVGGIAGGEMLSGSLEMRERLCTTPCVVDMKPGPYELKFTSVTDDEATSSAFINIDSRTSVYRHALGRQENNAWKGYVGWPLALVGAFSAVGLAVTAANGEGDLATFYGISTAIFGGLGGYLVYQSTVTEQAGTGVQWHP